MRACILAMILALACLLAGCRAKAPAGAADFFPESNAVQGWVKSSETRTFEASHLWEYIDGDADKYIQAGVVKTLTSDYRFNNKVDATADVYVMAKPEGAKKIYDSESAAESQPVDIGEAGRLSKGSLTFHQGPYFVRVVAYEDSAEVAKALTELARAVGSRLSKSSAGKS
ncbi:MAG: hypothetical protein LAO04_15770 [Acidobacteriia bacterium]|nr:hypothetical protein [Terriglobia bacterium]